MHVYYRDVIERIDEEPTWYSIHGYPRYGEFDPHSLNVYARYAILMEIECQSCRQLFLIGDAYTDMEIIQKLLDKTKIEGLVLGSEDQDLWVSIKYNSFAPQMKDDNGNNIYRHLTLEEIVKGFGYGDPPIHGCVGDTMNSVVKRSIQVWDMNHGRVVENNRITTWGNPARIPELEGLDLTPDWDRLAIE